MKVGCISNNDQCLPLLQMLKQRGEDIFLYIGAAHVNDGKREQLFHLCNTMNIPVTKEDATTTSLYSWMESIKPEVVFVLGHISRIKLQSIYPTTNIYNVHFGKLPEYRGASPVFWQLKNAEPLVGCAIHELTDKMDGGDVVWQKQIPFEEHFNWSYVHFLFSNIITEGARYIIEEKNSGRVPEGMAQDNATARWFHQPVLKDVLINWNAMRAGEICSLVKACDNWNNGAITLYNGMEVKIRDAGVGDVPAVNNIVPGTITDTHSGLTVHCGGDTQLIIHSLSINDLVVPGRFADKYGFVKGQCFAYPSD